MRFIPLFLLMCGAALVLWQFGDYLRFEALSANREALLTWRAAHPVLAMVGFVAVYMGIVGLSLPGAAVASLTGGFLFGLFPGTVLNMLGATLGGVVIFAAVRAGFGDRLAARMDAADGPVARIKAGLDANQWSMLFLIRLVPLVPLFAANLIPALLGVPIGRFVVSTFLGIIPGALVYTGIGAGLGQTFDRGEAPDLSIIFSPHILLPILGLCALAALPIGLRALTPSEEEKS